MTSRPKHDPGSVLVRPIEPGDFELERRFVDGVSPQTGYQRLMSPRRPSDDEVRRWTNIDPEREGALVAIVSSAGEERMIGVARYAMDEGADEAEFAIVLSDDWQGMGLGRRLLSALIEVARHSGVRRLFEHHVLGEQGDAGSGASPWIHDVTGAGGGDRHDDVLDAVGGREGTGSTVGWTHRKPWGGLRVFFTACTGGCAESPRSRSRPGSASAGAPPHRRRSRSTRARSARAAPPRG